MSDLSGKEGGVKQNARGEQNFFFRNGHLSKLKLTGHAVSDDCDTGYSAAINEAKASYFN